MGGSIARRGGHNILEPAFFARPVVIGPHMENFPEIAAEFSAGAACLEIGGREELGPAVDRLLRNAALSSRLGKQARQLAEAKGGAVIVHGAGVHPDFGMIGALRTALPEQGIATISVQMPVLAADAPREGYVELLPAAGERIAAAIAALRAKGVTKVAIVAHSMGAAMADAYLARPDAARIDAWVVVGMLADFKAAPRVPVLDVVAEKDFPEVLAATKVRALRLPKDGCSAAVVVKGVEHYFGEAGPQGELGKVVGGFLGKALGGGCGNAKQ
jgi:uncharacterized protein YcfJ